MPHISTRSTSEEFPCDGRRRWHSGRTLQRVRNDGTAPGFWRAICKAHTSEHTNTTPRVRIKDVDGKVCCRWEVGGGCETGAATCIRDPAVSPKAREMPREKAAQGNKTPIEHTLNRERANARIIDCHLTCASTHYDTWYAARTTWRNIIACGGKGTPLCMYRPQDPARPYRSPQLV